MKKFIIPMLLIGFYSIDLSSQSEFITTWKTNLPGATNESSIKIPINPIYTYDYKIDWNGDGVFDQFNVTGPAEHDYGVPGTYTVMISGEFPSIYFNNSGDKLKIVEINQWGNIQWQDMSAAFFGCENLNSFAADSPDLSQVMSMHRTFEGAKSYNGSMNQWDVSNIEDMSFLFRGASNFNQPINMWEVDNVTSMSHMFYEAVSFNQNINHSPTNNYWNTINVENMSSMFRGAISFNQPIGSWITDNVITMSRMFNDAADFNQDISYNPIAGYWNTSFVEDMSQMFHGATSFNQSIDNWKVDRVTNMSGMFQEASNFNRHIRSWSVDSVVLMASMFKGAISFNRPLSNWNTQNVTNMFQMFAGATSFNGDINSMDVSGAEIMIGMFAGATSFDQWLGFWMVDNVTNMENMFDYSGLSEFNYQQTLSSWSRHENISTDITIGVANLDYCNATGRTALIEQYNWTFIGDQSKCSGICTDNFENVLLQSFPWGNNAIWSQNFMPNDCDRVIIPDNKSTTISVDLNAQCFSIEIESGGELIIENGGSIEVMKT